MHPDHLLEHLLDYTEVSEATQRFDVAELLRAAALEIQQLRAEAQIRNAETDTSNGAA